MWKGLKYEYRTVDLLTKENNESEFRKINPYQQIPVLVIEDDGKSVTLVQSLAIIQYLEESYPETAPLLPRNPLSRAKVRIISDCIAAGIQPLQNLTVIEMLNRKETGSGLEFARKTMSLRFLDLEQILKDYSGKYCVGDEVTMADVCLAPQVYNAVRYGVDMTHFPIISRINDQLMKLDAFSRGHPDRQPDAGSL